MIDPGRIHVIMAALDEIDQSSSGWEDVLVDRIVIEEDVHRVIEAMRCLSSSDAELANMRWFHGMSLRVIGDRVGVHHTTVMRRLKAIRTVIMRTMMEDLEDSEIGGIA